MSNFELPDWLSEIVQSNETQSVRHAIIRFLNNSENKNIISDVQSLIRPIEIWRCEMKTLFVLYKLLLSYVVVFPRRDESESNK